MLGAVYYPHAAIPDENFLKHALLYWDQIEYILPWEDFDALSRYLTESTKAPSKFQLQRRGPPVHRDRIGRCRFRCGRSAGRKLTVQEPDYNLNPRENKDLPSWL